MKTYIITFLVLIAVLIQTSFLPALRPFGAVPDIVLVAVAAIAMGGPLVRALILAMAGGFLLDLVSGSDFGLQTGLLAVAVILSAFVRRSGLQIGIRVQLMMVVIVVTTLAAGIAILEIFFAGGRVQTGAAVIRWLTIMSLNLTLALFIGPIFARLAKVQNGYGETE